MSALDRSRAPEVGADPAFRFPQIVRHRLANGLQVRTVEHLSVPIVSFVLQIEGGLGADPVGREGLAAITADMLDEGIGSMSAIDVSDELARLGADYEVEAGSDALTISLTTLARFAERGAGLLAEMTTRPALREADFTRVRQLRLDRLKQLKDHPPAVAEEVFLRMLFGDHPYGHLAIGYTSTLQAITLDDVARFHASRFVPGRAVLVVAGALPHEGLLALAERAFGGWSGAAPDPASGPASAIVPVRSTSARWAVVPRDGAAQSELRIGQLSARRDTPDHAALVVMNAILGGQFVSRVNLKLREEKGFTYGARTGFDWHKGLGPFSLSASVHTASTAEAVADSLKELEAIRGSRPPSEEELSLARASLTRGYPRNFETVQQVARSVAQLALYDLPDSYFADFVPRINAVGAGEVIAAATKYLDPATLTTLVVGDWGRIGESLAAVSPEWQTVAPSF